MISLNISTLPEFSPPDPSGPEDGPVDHHTAIVPHQSRVAHLPFHLQAGQLRQQRPLGLKLNGVHL